MRSATAEACANIALVKYWGKRCAALNLPAAGSLSLTLDKLTTTTTVEFDDSLVADQVVLDGKCASVSDTARVSAFLDLIRRAASNPSFAQVTTHNSFPTASGLASSASGFAALAVAATTAAGLSESGRNLSVLARQGSGSAARSIYGGLVRMHAGELADGSDAFAEPVIVQHDFVDSLRMVVAIVGGGVPKTHGSREAMDHCAATSPLYQGWLAQVPLDLKAAETSISDRELPSLGAVVEANALAMHATALASRPAIVYWQPATLAVLAAVRELRTEAVDAWATMDAGPHVKVLTSQHFADDVAAALACVPGVSQTIICAAGPGARVIS